MRLILVLLCLAALVALAKPWLADVGDTPSSESSRAAPAAPRPRLTVEERIQAEREKIRTAPPIRLPEVTRTDPKAAFQPAVSPEEAAEIEARSQQALREMRERAEAVRRGQ